MGEGTIDDLTQKVKLTRHLGKNAPDLISRLAISSIIAAIEQLIDNAYDADAPEVYIYYNPEKDTLTISDNGTGMTPMEGLPAFYRLGDSPKVEQPISPKGRVRIGNLGVATILIKYLANRYEMETFKDGIKTSIEETFEDVLSSEKEIPYECSPMPIEMHGTTIKMSGLRFEEDKGFSLKELRKSIQWDFPLLPDFRVYVNEEEVIPKSITDAIKFRLDKTGKYMGHIYGTIYYCTRPTMTAGMHIYVNERAISDPKTFIDLSKVKGGLIKRLVGIINADDLKDARLFDKTRFREDHLGVIELKETLEKALYKVRHYVEREQQANYVRGIQAKVPVMLERIHARLLAAKIKGVSKETKIEFSDEIPENLPGLLEKNVLKFNSGYGGLVIDTNTNPIKYEQAILNATVDTIAISYMGSAWSMSKFHQSRQEIWQQLCIIPDESKKRELHPMMLYKLTDLARLSGKPLGVINYMTEGGLFKQYDEGVTGQDFLNAQNKVRGMISLYELLSDRSSINFGNIFQRLTEVLKKTGKSAEPFVRNFSNGDSLCYFVEGICADEIYRLLTSDSMYAGRKGFNPTDEFRILKALYFSVPDLVKRCNGMDLKQVSAVIDYAKKQDIKIQQDRSQGVRYNYADFIYALQYMRGNINAQSQ